MDFPSSPGVQTPPFTAEGTGLIRGQGSKIPQDARQGPPPRPPKKGAKTWT